MNWSISASFGELLTTWRTRCNLTQTALAAALGTHRNTIGRWERGEVLPDTKGMVLELARLLRLDEQEARLLLEASLTALTPYWTVPFRRNPSFTGREALLHQLHTHLAPSQPIALTRAVALSGLGGIGKTQLAIEYAYRYTLEYTAVFWLAAETAESLITSAQQIAEQLHLPEHQATDQFQVIATVQRWFATHAHWLVIADNVEDLDLLQNVLPPTRQGAFLLTTRRQTLGNLAEILEVPPLQSEDGVTLLLQRAHRLGVPVATTEAEAARELVIFLEGLPLALDQAGAYIDETGCSVEEYLQLSRSQRKQVLARRGAHGGNHPASVTTTLKLSAERVEREHPGTTDLLWVCAFLHAEAIPEELLVRGASHLGPVLGPMIADPYQFNLALAALRNASLVTRHLETRTLSIHRLVQAVLQDQIEPDSARLWGTRVIGAVNAAFPEPELSTWAQCERYLTHALACVPLIALAGGNLPEAGELLSKAGEYLLERGRLQEAKPLVEQAVTLGEQLHGPEHSMLLPRLNRQAELFWRQGEYRESERVVQHMLALGEQHLDPIDPHIARALSNLGVLSIYQGEYTRAEPLFLRALSIWEQRMGPEHPDTAVDLNNLALCYEKQGKYEQAEPLYRRALQVLEHALGSEHLRVSEPLHGLADLYAHQSNYAQAEPLYKRALCIREDQLGLEHHRLASPLEGLADCAAQRGEYKQAEEFYQRAVRVREQQMGSTHPEITITLKKLAALYQAQGQGE